VSEIIIADNSSTDGTVQIACNLNCKLTAGGVPAVGRNAGARIATEEMLLFVDADVIITREIFDVLIKEFSRPSTALVYFRMVPDSSRVFVRAAYRAADLYVRVAELLGTSQGSAPLICVRKSAFLEVGGFDEKMGAAEDVDFIRRVSRHMGGVRYVRSTPLCVSARRFDLEDGVRYAIKCIFWGLLRLVGLRTSFIHYRWERYSM
jgi:GT2 family glycosyltransferase